MKKGTKITKILAVVLLLALSVLAVVGCAKKETKAYQEWKEVLKDYDKWADDYIAFMKKYVNNSSSQEMLSDYTKLLAQQTAWTNKLANIKDDDEMTNSERQKILNEYSRITLKISKSAYSMA